MTKPVFTANVGLQAGYQTYGADGVLQIGPKGGVKVEKNGFHAGADVGVGTALTANVELGKEFNINKNVGIDLSLNGGTAVSMLDKSRASLTHHVEINGQEALNLTASKSWRPGVTHGGVKAMANFTTNNDKLKFGVGLSSQYVTNHVSDVSLATKIISENAAMQRIEARNSRQEGILVSPEVAVSYKLNDNISFKASGNALGGGVTASWTF